MLPIAAAARRGIPLVDADGMGRAFPELQMVTFTIGGASATPLAYSDEKGNAGVMNNVSNKWTEDIARADYEHRRRTIDDLPIHDECKDVP